MTRLIHSRIALAFQIAAGLITFLALADGGFAAPPPTVPIAFGATKPSGAALYGVFVGGTPAIPTLTATPLAPPWGAYYTPLPPVSGLAFLNTNGNALVASNSNIGDLYSVQSLPPLWQSQDGFKSGVCTVYNANGLGVDGGGNILGAGYYSISSNDCINRLGVFIFEQGDGVTPVLMDSAATDPTLFGGITTIVDAAVSPGTFANGIQAGDLLVLVGDSFSGGAAGGPPVVFVYPHSAIAHGLSSGFPVPGAIALVTHSNFLEGNYTPVSMAISPIDGTLLIATSDGTIWQLKPTATTGYQTASIYALPTFYPGSCFNGEGCGLTWGKIGAMQQGGSLYVFATVADNNHTTGIFAVFSGPTEGYYIAPTASAVLDAGVQPTSVAVLQQAYKTGTTLASNCYNTPCDILGDGTMTTLIDGNIAGIPAGATITQQECIVPADPRGPNCGAGSPGGAQSLPLKNVCPGLNDSRIIPSYLCGSAGPSGTGFIVIAGTAEQVGNTDGIYVHTEATTATELGSDPGCPQDVAGYQSNQNSSVETQFPEGNTLFEVTSSCVPPTPSSPDPTGKLSPHSIDSIGFALNLRQFARHGKSGAVGFVDFKSSNLLQTIRNSNIKFPWERNIMLFGVSVAQRLVDIGHYDCAAELEYLLDQFLRKHSADFLHSVPGATVREPNPVGDISMRLGNLFFRIETGIEHRQPYSSWPLKADPQLCHTNESKPSEMER